MPDRISVLFVCLGNICRSPLAEHVVADRAEQRGLIDRFKFSSAGTGSWHIGGPADHRSAMIASHHGLDMSGHRAQQITPNNWQQWQWFVAMDSQNKRDLLHMGVSHQQILMMRQNELDSASHAPDVPDPYYGGDQGFEQVYQMMERNADDILDTILRHEKFF